jgi:hypothetical protein
MFEDTTVATAVLDPLLHDAGALSITGTATAYAATATPSTRSDPPWPAEQRVGNSRDP